jgi:hypothetical protein
MAVSVLFAVYLVFEFQTLWFRKFPPGFHYSRYTHQGAAWLTAALGIATVTLCLIFHGPVLRDPRLQKLKFWTWIWSIENLILVLAVYHRLWIYIDYNGLSRLRTVGMLGVTSVLIGFLLVMLKISANRSALWLIQRQLVTVTLVGFSFVVLPVDWLIYSYNVRRIRAADLRPIAQITGQKLSTEALQALTALLESPDRVIRDGVRTRMEQWLLAEATGPNQSPGWTSFQLSHAVLAKTLSPLGSAQSDAESERRRADHWLQLRLLGYSHQL